MQNTVVIRAYVSVKKMKKEEYILSVLSLKNNEKWTQKRCKREE